MNAPFRRLWTQQDFFAWGSQQDGCYEFDGTQPVAMVGGTVGHGIIIGNLRHALETRLRGGPCRPLGPDAGLATVGNAVRYPDALVTCSKLDRNALLVPGAIVVFEVLSPNSGQTDRIIKVREYAAIATIRRYVILEYTSPGLTILERTTADEPWRATTLTAEDTLHMPEIGISVLVQDIYEGIEFPA